jgi:hypothetical protein
MDLRRRQTVEGLFVEGRFDTDPNSLHFCRSVVDAIVDTAEIAFERRDDNGRLPSAHRAPS